MACDENESILSEISRSTSCGACVQITVCVCVILRNFIMLIDNKLVCDSLLSTLSALQTQTLC